jgi:hypothetical protein
MGRTPLVFCLAILCTSCQAGSTLQLTATPEVENTPLPPPDNSGGFLDESQAEIAAINALRRRFTYTEPLTVIKIERMSYGDYAQLIQQPLNQPADLEVWAVIFLNDQFQSKPLANQTFTPYRGCVYVAVKAGSGAPVEVGGPLTLNSAFPECDN